MAYVYRHIREDKNEVFYIGIGKDNNFKRAYSKQNRNKYWKNITAITNYKIEILVADINYEIAKEKEIFFIALYGRKDIQKGTLVNLTDGGEGSKNMSDSHRKSIIKFNTGIIFTKERKDKIRNKATGRLITKDSKLKMSISQKKLDKSYLKNYQKGVENPRAFPIVQYSIDGKLIKKWEFAQEAIKSLKLNRTAITDCLKNRQKTAGGFIWKKEN